jgi:hypothetical protein
MRGDDTAVLGDLDGARTAAHLDALADISCRSMHLI